MFWENFVDLCNVVEKSPNAVCKELGLSNATATHWKNGSTPNSTTLKRIADYFSITVQQLTSDYEPATKDEINEGAGILSLFSGIKLSQTQMEDILQRATKETMQEYYDKLELLSVKTKKFRKLGEIACGKPMFAEEEFETFVEASEDINADFCVVAKGDSMINARIFDGDIVFIREQPDVENGEIAAVIIDDSVTLKRVYKYPNRLELRPENPTHKVQNYEGEELEQIRIIGKAVAFQSFIL